MFNDPVYLFIFEGGGRGGGPGTIKAAWKAHLQEALLKVTQKQAKNLLNSR